MSIDEHEAWLEEAQEAYDREVGEWWLKEYGYELYPEHYEEAVKEFTTERLRSYYVSHPHLAGPAYESLL
jgi:hypothetical protein